MPTINLAPQEGPQTSFHASSADIAIYGGAAGGGKTYSLLLEPLRHYNNKDFQGVIFRREGVQIRNPGGLWDESHKIYGPLKGSHAREAFMTWDFPTGFAMKFAHLEHEKSVYNWQGAQIPYIGFDELTHFTMKQFFYLLSRNRSTSGVPGYIRATTNPDVDSWVRKFIDWWIDADGQAIPERSGVIRWFIRQDDNFIWADTREELVKKYGEDQEPKSVTFIEAKLSDNKILMMKDPSYRGSLMALNRVDRLRLLGANWNVRASAGMLFRKAWFEVIDAMPSSSQIERTIRYWDRAATEPSENNTNPDWTVGVLMHKMTDGTFIIADIVRDRLTPGKVEKLIWNTATQDGYEVIIGLEQDPGSAGVSDIANMTKKLAGWHIQVNKPSKDKVTRAKPLSAQVEAGNVKVLRAPWNDAWFQECESFPTVGVKDDQIDGASGGFNELCGNVSTLDSY